MLFDLCKPERHSAGGWRAGPELLQCFHIFRLSYNCIIRLLIAASVSSLYCIISQRVSHRAAILQLFCRLDSWFAANFGLLSFFRDPTIGPGSLTYYCIHINYNRNRSALAVTSHRGLLDLSAWNLPLPVVTIS